MTGSARPRVLGVDLSLTSTGVAGYGWAERLVPPRGLDGLPRLRWLRDAVLALEFTHQPDLVVVEGLAYSRTTGKAAERAGLWHLVVERLDGMVPWAQVPPTARAKYATGKGNAPKDAVLAAVVRRFPDFDVTGNDQADALVLAAMGLDHLGHPPVVMPAAHRASLNAVVWP